MASSTRIVAVLPAFNEEKTIGRVILGAERYVDRIIVVDDGSSDLTASIAKRLGVEVICHPKNLGKGAALKTGFDYVEKLDPEVVVTIDTDGQHDPDEIPKLTEPILNGDIDITVGSRTSTKKVEMPLHRQIGNGVLNKLVNLFGKQTITDTQSGYRAYGKRAMRQIDVTTMGIGVDSEILMKAYGHDLKIKEIPVSCRYKGVEGSTYNPLKHAMNVIAFIVRYASEKRPLLIFGLPGTIALGSGLLLLIQVLQSYAITRQFAIGTMLASMIAILAGVFAIFTAIILYTISNLIQKLE